MKCFLLCHIKTSSLLSVSLLGLLAKIKCSICSYQFNIWYTTHRVVSILNWFLVFGLGCGACFSQTMSPPRIAVPRGWAHLLLGRYNNNAVNFKSSVSLLLHLRAHRLELNCSFQALSYNPLHYLTYNWENVEDVGVLVVKIIKCIDLPEAETIIGMKIFLLYMLLYYYRSCIYCCSVCYTYFMRYTLYSNRTMLV